MSYTFAISLSYNKNPYQTNIENSDASFDNDYS